MSNQQQIAQALKDAPPIVLSSISGLKAAQPAPEPHQTWKLPGGTAWVYYGVANRGLIRPVILTDGFNSGPSTLDAFWEGLNEGAFPLVSELQRRRRDAILLGYDDRAASIPRNAETVIEAIRRARAERLGTAPLAVGGFSMGGLVTRYALAKMEYDRIDHETGLYWSWDTPHRGAYVPVSLQAFAHYIKAFAPGFSNQINSPAARQMLVRHLADVSGTPGVDPERTRFLNELARFDGWPHTPRLIGVANGAGNGHGNGTGTGESAVRGTGAAIAGTDLRTQPKAPDTLAARLRIQGMEDADVQAPGVPLVDGAPGGTLDGFKILADTLNAIPGLEVSNPIASHCFVPSVSAVSIRGVTDENLYTDISGLPPDESELNDFLLSDGNGPHAAITATLAEFLLHRLPD